MVKILLCLIYFCGLGLQELGAVAPVIEASIDSTNNPAHFPIQGTITITHDKEEEVDPSTFRMQNKPLDVSFVKEVKMSAAKTIVSIYTFQLPAQDKGLYILPSLSATIGHQTYYTIPSTYSVVESIPDSSIAPGSSKKSQGSLIFRLDASVQGPSTLYPGERTKLMYRISYNQSVDLTRSVLPMIHPPHFLKIGDVHIRDYQVKEITVQDLTQEVEASEVGTFTFGPSSIEGHVYTMRGNKKEYDPKLVKATAPNITLRVKPFPQKIQPLSFTGGLGKIQVESRLISSDSMIVGETLKLQVKVRGLSNLNDFSFPSLECQPGFSGFFLMSDLPPFAEIKEGTKSFEIELRPITALIQEIPSMEFSSFDPKTGLFVVQETKTIPITIKRQMEEENISAPTIPILTPISSLGRLPNPELPTLELRENSMQLRTYDVSGISRNSFFWFFFFGIVLLLLQVYLKKQLDKHPRPQLPKSEILFGQALKKESLQLLEQAFWERIWEKGKMPWGSMDPGTFSGPRGEKEIADFIFQLQAWQYGMEKNGNFKEIKRQAKQLFHKI